MGNMTITLTWDQSARLIIDELSSKHRYLTQALENRYNDTGDIYFKEEKVVDIFTIKSYLEAVEKTIQLYYRNQEPTHG